MAEAATKKEAPKVNETRVTALKICREMSRKKSTRVKDIIAEIMAKTNITKPNAEYYYRRVFLVQKEKAVAAKAEKPAAAPRKRSSKAAPAAPQDVETDQAELEAGSDAN